MNDEVGRGEMVISCAACGTRFRVPVDSLRPNGKLVKCSKCGHRWFQEPPPEAGEPVPEEVRKPPPAEGARAGAPDGRRLRVLGWALLLLLLAASGFVVVGRHAIVARWPEAAAFYARLGLPVELELGLEIRDLEARRVEDGGISTLVVQGVIHNRSGGPRLVPPIRVRLLDEQGRELAFGLYRAERERLEAGTITRFEARLDEPPPAAVRYEVTFLERPEVR